MSFQENLIRARKARGMTQEELAAKAEHLAAGGEQVGDGGIAPRPL